MTGIDDLIICPRCLKPMGDDVTVTTCQYCGYKECDNLNDTIEKGELEVNLNDYE